MKKSAVTTYSFLVVLILIILAGWIGYTFFTGTSDSQADFRKNLPEVNSRISSLLKETGNPGSDSFKGDMEEFLQSRPEIKGLLIYSDDNRLFYTRLESKNNRLMDNLQKNELFLLEQIEEGTYRPPVGIAQDASFLMSLNGTSLKISYLHETFSPRQIYDLLLMAIYIISGLFLLTLILLVATSVREKKKGVGQNDDFFEPPSPDPSQINEGSLVSEERENDDFALPEDKEDNDLSSFDMNLPDEDLGSMDFDMPESSLEESDLDFELPDMAQEDDELGSMDFDLPEESSDDELGAMDFDLPEESSDDELETMDFDLPEESSDEDELETMDFDLPEESSDEDELETMDFDLPEESSDEDELENMDFDLPEESSDEDELENMDFDLPEESSDDDELETMDFDLPEESSDEDELEAMDFDLPEESSDEDELEAMDFYLPEESSDEDELEAMDFDLPEESSDEDELEAMDFYLPEESSDEDELEAMDFDLPEESSDEDELEAMDFDLPEESSDEDELEAMDFDLSNDDSMSLDEGGDLFNDSDALDGSLEDDEEMEDLPDEVDDLIEELSDEDILGEETLEIDDTEDIEDLPDLEDFMASDGLMEELDDEKESSADSSDMDESPQLYSPRSQVCWENFIDDRLPQEIERAAGENEDISFVYLRDNTVENDDDYRSFAEDLTKDFPYRDMIFEWGDQGFAMIFPNSDLVETLEKLDVFVNEKPERDIRIGVTSRNGRLLDKEQLIEEASAAISRTSVDNKIVGFRADPERYRQVLSEEGEE